MRLEPGRPPVFHAPRLARFDEALAFVRAVAGDYSLIGLDQPTVVANRTGMRPAERVAASVVSWIGGGVQPANRGRTGMFCDAAPIWGFLRALGAGDDPPAARTTPAGLYVMEVFPALALASLEPVFGRRLAAPKYNPANRRRFDLAHWRRVCGVAARWFDAGALAQAAAWCRTAAALPRPVKADQDRLDAMLCLLITLRWRFGPVEGALMIGDLAAGYIVTPVSPLVRGRLTDAARRLGVAIDGVVPG